MDQPADHEIKEVGPEKGPSQEIKIPENMGIILCQKEHAR
jgi:hypothetical protein